MTTDNKMHKPKVCMIVQQRDVKGGIAAVTNGYYGSVLEDKYDIRYVESYCDGSKFKKIIKAIKGWSEFRRVLGDFRPELVHIHSSFGGSFYRMQPFLNMARKRNIPVLDHCHGADFDHFYVSASQKKKNFIRKVYSRYDRIIVLSEEWKQKFSEVVPEDKLTVIQNYCKVQPKEVIEPVLEDRFARKQVVFLGEIGRRKGGFDLPEIIRNTVAKMPDVRFVICGDGAKEDVAHIKEEIANICPGAKVSFAGWVRDDRKHKVLMESAVFMLPSYQEGQPMSILDAMAYGLPVVSTEVGGIPQQVEDGVNGYLTKPGDVQKTAESLVLLLSDKDKYIAASRESLNIASSKYGFEAHEKRLEEEYDLLLKRG